MTTRRKVLQGAAWVTVGEGVGYAASFVRNMILARLLSKADFGMAAVFGMVLSLLEFTAKLGVGRFLVRDKEGDEPAFVATGHALQAVAALCSAILIVLLAPLLARWFGIGDHAWALMVLAGMVLARGLQHLDVQRFERHLRFGPSAMTEAVPQVLITVAAWPLATWLPDYRAVLILLMGKALVSLALSHALAERPYRWTWHPEFGRRMIRFGWPLLLTGFLMFGIMQGDQFLVATFYDMTDLAPYAAAVALVMAPQFLFGRVFNTVTLPLVARVQDDAVLFVRRYQQVVGAMTLYAAISTAVLMVGAEAWMRGVYGAKYAGAGVLMAWLAAVAAFRALRMAVAVANIAKGDSQSQLIANLWRTSSLLPAFWVASQGRPLWWIAACGLIGELLATGACVWRLWKQAGVPVGLTLRPALGLLVLTGACGLTGHWAGDLSMGLSAILAGLLGLTAGAVVMIARAELRVEAVKFWRALVSEGPREALRSWLGTETQSTGPAPAPTTSPNR